MGGVLFEASRRAHHSVAARQQSLVACCTALGGLSGTERAGRRSCGCCGWSFVPLADTGDRGLVLTTTA